MAALALLWAGSVAPVAPAANERPSAASKTKARAEARAKAAARRTLGRQVRHDPKAVLRPGFIKKAQAVDYALPITVRLNPAIDPGGAKAASDDQLQVAYDSSVFAWPLTATTPGYEPPAYQPPPAQLTTLSGSFTMELDFGADTSGYGSPGVVETRQGQGVSMSGTPFAISDFTAPVDPGDPTTPACTQPAVEAGPALLTSAGTARGVIDLFNRRIRGTLRVHAAFNARRYDCGHTPAGSSWTLPVHADAMPPMPFSFDGAFRISPAITADGRIRLGVMDVVDQPATPQASTFAFFNTCTAGAGVLLTDAAPGAPFCAAPDLQAFPARLTPRKLSAELLIGGGA
jgi:hypothetical protein